MRREELRGLAAGRDGVVEVELLLHEGVVLVRALVLRVVELALLLLELVIDCEKQQFLVAKWSVSQRPTAILFLILSV